MGIVTISIDAELAWGFHDFEKMPIDRLKAGRTGWETLLEIFDRYNIPTTWAIVTHLMLESCDGRHADHPATKGWSINDPADSATGESNWVAPELIKSIQNSTVGHEIGCHGFSHVEFGDENTSRQLADAELFESISLAKQWNINFDSFVFPRNNIGHREALAEHGFRCYRGHTSPRWYDGMPMRSIGKSASMIFGRSPPPLVEPEIDEYGLVEIPASFYLFTFEGILKNIAKHIKGDPVVRKAKLGIDHASRSENGIFHMWLHPNDLTKSEDINRMHNIFRYLDHKRNVTDLQILTMNQIVKRKSLY